MRPRVDVILIGMRTGAQWRIFAKKSTLHEWFQRLSQSGVWKALWILFVEKARAEGKTDEGRVFLDGNITKAPLGGDKTGASLVHRGRLGSKRSVMTDGEGYPIVITLSGANKHDSKMLAATLAARILPLTGVDLVMDNGYRGKPAAMVAIAAGFSPILPPKRGEQKSGEARSPVDPRHKGRWKIERTFAWLTVFRTSAKTGEKVRKPHGASSSLGGHRLVAQVKSQEERVRLAVNRRSHSLKLDTSLLGSTLKSGHSLSSRLVK